MATDHCPLDGRSTGDLLLVCKRSLVGAPRSALPPCRGDPRETHCLPSTRSVAEHPDHAAWRDREMLQVSGQIAVPPGRDLTVISTNAAEYAPSRGSPAKCPLEGLAAASSRARPSSDVACPSQRTLAAGSDAGGSKCFSLIHRSHPWPAARIVATRPAVIAGLPSVV
jgi:hypothetical protein